MARKPVDLETAAQAVMGRCSAEIRAEEQSLISQYPGYRDYIQPRFRAVNEERLNDVRRFIAARRTR